MRNELVKNRRRYMLSVSLWWRKNWVKTFYGTFGEKMIKQLGNVWYIRCLSFLSLFCLLILFYSLRISVCPPANFMLDSWRGLPNFATQWNLEKKLIQNEIENVFRSMYYRLLEFSSDLGCYSSSRVYGNKLYSSNSSNVSTVSIAKNLQPMWLNWFDLSTAQYV